MFYCSLQCQRNDWLEAHKFGECRILANRTYQKVLKNDTDRLLLRILFKFQHDKKNWTRKVDIYNGTQRSANDLVSNVNFIENDINRMELFRETEKKFTFLKLSFDSKTLLELLGKQLCNTITITTNCFQRLGHGFYVQMSCLDHSCAPDAAAVFEGIRCQIRILRDVDNDKPIFINYIDLKIGKVERQRILSEKYYFTCECERCATDDDFDYDRVNQLDEQLNQLMVEGCDWSQAYELSSKMLDMCQQLYRTYHPVLTVQMVRTLQTRLYKYHFDENRSDGEKKAIEQFIIDCVTHIEITHGLEHSLYTKDLKNILDS